MNISWESEKEMEDYIVSKKGIKMLEQYILTSENEYGKDGAIFAWRQIKRQFNMGDYGIADVVIFNQLIYGDFSDKECIYPDTEIIVIELKNDKLKLKDLSQLSRYASGLKHLMRGIYPLFSDTKIRPIIITPTSDHESESCFMCDNSDIEWYSLFFDTERTQISLNENEGWVKTGETKSITFTLGNAELIDQYGDCNE